MLNTRTNTEECYSVALPNLRIKSLLCHSFFHALTSSITFVYRLMLNACLLSPLECSSLSTSLLECLCFTLYHLLALAYQDHLIELDYHSLACSKWLLS